MTDSPDLTPLDSAHAAMEANPDNDSSRLSFYNRVADSELFLLLEREAEGERITPRVFDVETGQVVLVFDREARLAAFAGEVAPYAAMSGRSLVQMLSGHGIGLGINLDVAPSAILLPATAVEWLHEHLQEHPEEGEARPSEVRAPVGFPEALLSALDAKLATAAGLADLAFLVGVTYADGRKGHLLAFVDAVPEAQGALARAANEALIFSGIDAGSLDVAFFPASDGIAPQLAKVGLRFDLPKLASTSAAPGAPGVDPDRPPILR